MSRGNRFIPDTPKVPKSIGEAPFQFQFLTAGELIDAHPDRRPGIIDGLLREGETLNLNGGTKTMKSWFTLAMSLSVACGVPWLGKKVQRGDVLYLDNELHPETIAQRIKAVAEAMGLNRRDYQSSLVVESLRGRIRPLSELVPSLVEIERGRFKVVAFDALYRFAEEGSDENSNNHQTQTYNRLDLVAQRIGAANVVVHHSTKGNQSAKSTTDIGAGGGAQARAADCHLALIAHREKGCQVLRAELRDWPAFAPVCLRWNYPTWSIDNDLDPEDLAVNGVERQERHPQMKVTDDEVITIVRECQPVSSKTLKLAIETAKKCSGRKAEDAIASVKAKKLIVPVAGGGNKTEYYGLPGFVCPRT